MKTRDYPLKPLAMCLSFLFILAMGACSGKTTNSVVTLSLFQTKTEALDDYNDIIADFEKDHPGIRVVQNQVASADTALRALLIKDRTPDVISLNPNGSMGKIAQAGVFYDFSNSPIRRRIRPAMQAVANGLGRNGNEINILSFMGNVCGITYNKDLFKKYGVEIPKTWKDLEKVVNIFESNGVTPFIGTLGDPYRIATPFDGLAPYYDKDGFWDKMRAEGTKVGTNSSVSFEKTFKPLMERLLWMFHHATKDVRTMTYEDGNAAFARGDAAMLLAGNWCMNPIRKINPNIHMGFFPYPPDKAEDSILVSGNDLGITMPVKPKHEKESLEFINYLFTDKVQAKFAKSEELIPSLKSLKVDENKTLSPSRYWIESGRIKGYSDHQIPSSISYNPILNKAMLDGDIDGALATLDNEWRKVSARTLI